MSAAEDQAFDRAWERALAALERDEPVDAAVIAREEGLDAQEFAACFEGLKALEGLGRDFHADVEDLEPEPAIQPILPDDYVLLGELGRGGMGIVYKARQRSLGREVAVKVLRPGEIHFAKAVSRFKQEARALARLRHPNIVSIHEVGEVAGHVFFAMDLIDGRSLAQEIRAHALTPSQTVKIMKEVASAIAYTHARGLIHRDLKPLNILLDQDGKAFVTDFGLARSRQVEGDLTLTGQVIGTPQYMSPEQARGEHDLVGEATDVWAMGAVLYECLTGKPPFSGTSPVQVLNDVLHREPRRPAKLEPSCPAGLDAIAMKALSKNPDERYPTAQAFLEDLERFEQGRALLAVQSSSLQDLWRFGRRHAAALMAAVSMAAILIALFIVTILPRLGSDPETARRLGNTLWAQGQKEAAAQAYEVTLRSELEDDEALHRWIVGQLERGRRLRQEGQATEAEATLRKAFDRCRDVNQREPKPGATAKPLWPEQFEIHLELARLRCEEHGPLAARAMEDELRKSWYECRNGDAWLGLVGAIAVDLDASTASFRTWALEFLRRNSYHTEQFAREHPAQRSRLAAALFFDPTIELRRIDSLAPLLLTTVDHVFLERAMQELGDATRPRNCWAMALLCLERTHPPLALRGHRPLSDYTDAVLDEAARFFTDMRAASRLNAYQMRIERRLARCAGDVEGLAPWFQEQTTFDPSEASWQDVLDWWTAHRSEDPGLRWKQALGLAADAQDPFAFHDRLDGPVSDMRDNWLQNLVVWSRERDAERASKVDRRFPLEAWKEIELRERYDYADLHFDLAVFAIRDGVLQAKPIALTSIPVAVGREDVQRSSWDRAEIYRESGTTHAVKWELCLAGSPITFNLPAASWHRDLQLSTHLHWNGRSFNVGLSYEVDGFERGRRFGFGQSGPGIPIDQIQALVQHEGGLPGFVSDDELILGLTRSRSSELRPDSLDSWRRAISASLVALLDRLETSRDFSFERNGDMVLPAVTAAAMIGTPESMEVLRAIEERLASFDTRTEAALATVGIARLMSGDRAVQSDIEARGAELLVAGLDDVEKDDVLRHVALNAPAVETRTWAARQVNGTDSLRPERADSRSGSLPQRIITQEPLTALFLLAFYLVVGGTLVLLAVRSKPRRVLAALLLLLGMVMLTLNIEFEGAHLMPNALAFVLAALGAHVLGKALAFPQARLAAWCFTVLILLELAKPIIPFASQIKFALFLLTFPGLFALYHMSGGRSLESQGRSLFGSFPIRLFGFFVAIALVTAHLLREYESDFPQALFWLGLIACLIGARWAPGSHGKIVGGARIFYLLYLPFWVVVAWGWILVVGHKTPGIAEELSVPFLVIGLVWTALQVLIPLAILVALIRVQRAGNTEPGEI